MPFRFPHLIHTYQYGFIFITSTRHETFYKKRKEKKVAPLRNDLQQQSTIGSRHKMY